VSIKLLKSVQMSHYNATTGWTFVVKPRLIL